ncbi:MAG TPA: hypothetical protein PLF13_03710 [candidate division Zixibacteria bacterium]|nr:hypothetical protein [candidate division Zixibacteria bacterium]
MNDVDHNSSLAAVLFFTLLLILAAVNLFDLAWFWSIDFAPYYPGAAIYIGIGLLLLGAWDPVRSWVYQLLAKTGERINRKSRSGKIIMLGLAAAVFVVLTILFSSATNLTGDASLRLNQLDSGRWWLPTEAGDFVLHALWNRVISEPLGLTAADTYRWFSILCGIFFVINSARLSFYLFRERGGVVFLLLFTGTAALFFGYIESYSLIAALLPQLLLSALRAIEGTGSRVAFVLWFVVGTVVHSVTPILFAGVLLVVLTVSDRDEPSRRSRLNRFFLILTAAGLVVLFLLRGFGLFDLPRYVMGFTASGPYEISLLDSKHWQNVIGWLLLTALPFLFLLPSTLSAVRSLAVAPRKFLAVWLMIPSLLFILLFLPQLGGVRDWDLFSLAGWLLTAGALIVLDPDDSVSGCRCWSWVAPVVLMTLLVTGMFTGVNASMKASVDRFARTLDQSRVRNQIWEYLNLIDHAQSDPAVRNRVPEFARKAWQQPPYRPVDSLNIIRRLHYNLVERNRAVNSVEAVASSLGFAIDDESAWLLLARYFLNAGSPAEQENLAEILGRHLPNSSRAQMYAGVVNLKQQRFPLAEQRLGRAYQLDSADVDIVLNYGSLQFEEGKLPAAERLFERAMSLDSTSYLACYNLALIAERERDIDRSASLARKALSLTSVPTQQQAAQALLERLDRK